MHSKYPVLLLAVVVLLSCGKKTKEEESIITTEEPASVKDAPVGEYNTADNTGNISIIEVGLQNSFRFELLVATADGLCVGELEGTATYNLKTGYWLYDNEATSCSLQFRFSGETITILEQGECDHGASCSFAGSYIKSDPVKEGGTPLVLNNVMDFYLAIPDEYFDCEIPSKYSVEQRSAALKHKNIPNGYMKANFVELADLQLALFKDKSTGKSFLAFVNECGGGCMCIKRHFLSYEKGEWKDHYDEIFPDLSDLENETNIALRLPEKGTTIEVYDYENPDVILANLKWSGNKFLLEKK